MLFITTFVLGVVFYGLDAYFGKGLFRGIYRVTHAKDATPPADPPSFIAGRSVAGRIPAALVLTVVFAVLMSLATVHSLLGLMAKSVVMFVMLMLGFTVAAYAHRWWNPAEKAKKVMDTLEGLESGAIDPTKKAREMMHSASERVKGMAAEVLGDEPAVAKSTESSAPAKPDEATKPDEEGKQLVRDAEDALEQARQAIAEAPEAPPAPPRQKTFEEKLEDFKRS